MAGGSDVEGLGEEFLGEELEVFDLYARPGLCLGYCSKAVFQLVRDSSLGFHRGM